MVKYGADTSAIAALVCCATEAEFADLVWVLASGYFIAG
jgi:hypothetical protein